MEAAIVQAEINKLERYEARNKARKVIKQALLDAARQDDDDRSPTH